MASPRILYPCLVLTSSFQVSLSRGQGKKVGSRGLIAGSVVLQIPIFFPNPPAIIYFPESSDSCSNNSFQFLYLQSVGEMG